MMAGADPGEVKWVNFYPPPPFFSGPPSFFFFSYPSNIEIIFDLSDIITKIQPPFQNPESAPGWFSIENSNLRNNTYTILEDHS